MYLAITRRVKSYEKKGGTRRKKKQNGNEWLVEGERGKRVKIGARGRVFHLFEIKAAESNSRCQQRRVKFRVPKVALRWKSNKRTTFVYINIFARYVDNGKRNRFNTIIDSMEHVSNIESVLGWVRATTSLIKI